MPMRFGFIATALETSGVTAVISVAQHCPYSCRHDKILSPFVKRYVHDTTVLQTLDTATHVNLLYTDMKKINRLSYKGLNKSVSQVAYIRTSNTPT
jgi:hypothetical protein